MRNRSYENDFDLHENETACRTHFIWKVSHLDSFSSRGTRELGNGLLVNRPSRTSYVLWLASAIGHFRILLCLCFKTSLSAKPFIWKWVLHAVSFSCISSHFHKHGFALRLALKQRHKGTRKWPITLTGALRPVYTGDICGNLSGDFCGDFCGDSKSPV